MKTILRFTAATAFMFATVASTAMETKNVAPYSDTELEILEAADKGKPIFRKKGDKVYLNMLNLQGNKVEIIVFDSNKRMLFREIVSEGSVEKAFNFENAYADNYTVIVRDSEGTYRENIIVK